MSVPRPPRSSSRGSAAARAGRVTFPATFASSRTIRRTNVVVRRPDYAAALDAGVDDERLVAWLARARPDGRSTRRTRRFRRCPRRVFWPHLHATRRHARARGAVGAAQSGRAASARRRRFRSFRPPARSSGRAPDRAPGRGRDATSGIGLVAAYVALSLVVGASGGRARFRSLRRGCSPRPRSSRHRPSYVAGFVRGFSRRR